MKATRTLWDGSKVQRAADADNSGRLDGAIPSKKRFFIILSCVLLFLFEHSFLLPDAIGASTDCPEGIAGYWSLDETNPGSYVDSVGTNDGTCSGGACPGQTSGIVSNGQLFDGADTIAVNADASFNWSAAQSFTIELWMRRNTGTPGNPEAFIGRADAAGLNWYIGINSSGYAQARLRAANGLGPSALTVSKDLRSNSTDPTWHHVALVHNAIANTNTLYVDSEQSASQTYTYTSGFASDTAPLTLGALDGGNFFNNGGLDEVAIYGRALSADEIRRHYYLALGYCSLYDAPITIMPMGDSITKGYMAVNTPPDAEMIGYRYDLWELLRNNLYSFDFTGSQHNGSGFDAAFDDQHAGFAGIRDDQLYTLLATGTNPQNNEVLGGGDPYLVAFPTELILLHIGTNGLESDQTATDVANILDQIDTFSKNVTVILARIIDRAPNDPNVPIFNNNIATMVTGRIALGDKIIMVDMQNGAGLTYIKDTVIPYVNGDMYDLLHPNPSGYSKMAGKWFATLETILPQSDIPQITSPGITEAAKGELYTYTVTATGPPSPRFELTHNPAPGDMTINSVSGLIQWTPDAIGDYDVTVRAWNWTGEDTQSFTISVNALPQAVGDAYSGVLEGGTLTVSAAQGVLNNDTDENDPLSAVLTSDVLYGTLNLNADGSFTYIHDGSENFNDSFTYAASDGKAESSPVTVTLTITPVDDSDPDPVTPSGSGGGSGCFITTLF